MDGESLGGYRIVRKVGEGDRAEVFLAHADGEQEPAVVKVYRPGVSDRSIMSEIECLERAAGEHTVRLLDVASDGDGSPVLILQRLAAGSLARLCADRASLELGEAITILAPVAVALARIHRAGVAHGGVGAGAVLFDPQGTPVLACFGGATLIERGLPAAALDDEKAVVADVAAFAALAVLVLARVADDGAARLAHQLETTPLTASGGLEDLTDRLFALGDAGPVDLRARAGESVDALPARFGSGAPVPEPAPVLPSWVARLLPAGAPAVVAPVLAGLAHRLRRLGEVRRPVWIALGLVALLLATAIVVVPRDSPGSAHEPATAVGAASEPGHGSSDGSSDVDIGDPVRAAVALLAARQECIEQLSVGCLEAVDQAGSAALVDDQQLVRQLQGGGELPEPGSVVEPELVERLGDTALVAFGSGSEPAAVLIMRGESGWLIRDYLEQ